ncbi:MAG: hypothetical protein R6V72_11705 [Cyclobacterium sp.]|uniref:hypothetical protein n=1 Tax=Cyclobacterium sp. TaxID=1966343 RepID=UPI003970C634
MHTDEEIIQMLTNLLDSYDSIDLYDAEDRKKFILEGMTLLIEKDDDFALKEIVDLKIIWEPSDSSEKSEEELNEVAQKYNDIMSDFVVNIISWGFMDGVDLNG